MNTNAYLNTFGKRVRILRTERDWTQIQLTEELKKAGALIGRTYVSGWERNDTIPSGEIVKALADVLETTTDYLLMRTDDAAPITPEAEITYFSPEADEVAQMVDAIPVSNRALAVSLVRVVAESVKVSDESIQSHPTDLPVLDSLYAILRQRGMSDGDAVAIIRELNASPNPPMNTPTRRSRRENKLS